MNVTYIKDPLKVKKSLSDWVFEILVLSAFILAMMYIVLKWIGYF